MVDVPELKASLATVDPAQLAEHRLQLHRLAAAEHVRLHVFFQLFIREAQPCKRERSDLRPLRAQRIKMCRGMAERTEMMDRVRHAHAEAQRLFRQCALATFRRLSRQFGHAELKTFKER